MNLQDISIKKLKSICLESSNDVNFASPKSDIKLQLQFEAMKLGFIFTEEAVDMLAINPSERINVFGALAKMIGADKKWYPFYQNFPKQVFELSETELYWNAIIHYLSCGEFRLEITPETEMDVPIFDDKIEYKKIGLCNHKDIENLIIGIVSSNGSITEFDKSIIEWYVEKNCELNWINKSKISFKETLCYLTGLLFEKRKDFQDFGSFIKTATDVLRVAIYFSKGDISLGKKSLLYLTNPQRRFIANLLEETIAESEIAKHKREFIALFHCIHIGKFKNLTKCNYIANKLRNEKIRSKSFLVEDALVRNDAEFLLNELPKNMGDFGRRLDHLVRKFNDDRFINSFIDSDNISKVDTRVLIQILSHFSHRNINKYRVVIPKGVTTKAYLLENNPLCQISFLQKNTIISGITNELKKRFGCANKAKGGSVWISEELKKVPVPLQMRTAPDGLYTMQRGTRIGIPRDKNILRFFIHWIGQDIDLSSGFLDEDMNYLSSIAFFNLRNEGGYKAVHSGDITYAPAPNGACEFIDIDLDSIKDKNVRYISLDVRVYNGGSLKEQQVNAGWMLRDNFDVQKTIFDAKTVEQRIAVNTESDELIVALFDVKEREIIWVDISKNERRISKPNTIFNCRASVKNICQMAANFKSFSLYDLFYLHATSSGAKLLKEKDEADVVYDNDWMYRYNEVLSEYL